MNSKEEFSSWTFSIKSNPDGDQEGENVADGDATKIPQHMMDCFQKDGFVFFSQVLSLDLVNDLNDELEDVLRGKYNRTKPDKRPKLIKPNVKPSAPLGFTGNHQNIKVLQVINIHKANDLFRSVATSSSLGHVVAQLAGWDNPHFGGSRLAQDQVWAKPPSAPPLSFHRDSPYFMFDPPDQVVTVWIALDDMEEEIGPLQYVVGSHLWGNGRCGTSNQFFGSQKGGLPLVYSAAEREGIAKGDIRLVSMAGLKAGGISIHHGRTWHGSGRNGSRTKPRRGLGLHFVPRNVKWTADAAKSRLWKPYVEGVEDLSKLELCPEDFPITWTVINS